MSKYYRNVNFSKMIENKSLFDHEFIKKEFGLNIPLQKKHYTILDFFEPTFYKKHPAWTAISDYLPDVLTPFVIQYLNPKPGDTAPFPKKIAVWEDKDNDLFKKYGSHYAQSEHDSQQSPNDDVIIGCYKMIVWYDSPYTPEIGNVIYPAKVTYGHVEAIPGMFPVKYDHNEVYFSIDTDSIDQMIKMEDLYLHAKRVIGVSFFHVQYSNTCFTSRENRIKFYRDPYAKESLNECTMYESKNIKNIYVNFFHRYNRRYHIYQLIFSYLHKYGRSIEDLNYATSITMKIFDEKEMQTLSLDDAQIEIRFSHEKQRDLLKHDYENNVILHQYNVDLAEYTHCPAYDNYCHANNIYYPPNDDRKYTLNNRYIVHSRFGQCRSPAPTWLTRWVNSDWERCRQDVHVWSGIRINLLGDYNVYIGMDDYNIFQVVVFDIQDRCFRIFDVYI